MTRQECRHVPASNVPTVRRPNPLQLTFPESVTPPTRPKLPPDQPTARRSSTWPPPSSPIPGSSAIWHTLLIRYRQVRQKADPAKQSTNQAQANNFFNHRPNSHTICRQTTNNAPAPHTFKLSKEKQTNDHPFTLLPHYNDPPIEPTLLLITALKKW